MRNRAMLQRAPTRDVQADPLSGHQIRRRGTASKHPGIGIEDEVGLRIVVVDECKTGLAKNPTSRVVTA